MPITTTSSRQDTYRYVAGVNLVLVQDRILRHNSTVINASARIYDRLNRLTSLVATTPAQPAQRFAYQYNLLNQRTQLAREDGSVVDYGYDDLGQLTNATRHWSDGQAVAGQQFAYGFDTIGNRLMTWNGGDANGQNLRVANYTNNSVNQLIGRSVPNGFDVIGETENGAGVTVNSNTPSRHDTYFRAALTVNNTTGAVYQAVNVTGGTEYFSGNVFVPKHPETLGYDDDGNMTYDGRFGHTWTAENRMRSSETVASAYHAGAPRQQLYYEEDYIGRRIGKTVYEWYSPSNAFCLKAKFTFAFAGWNAIYEQRVERDSPVNAWTTNVISYTWGLDASGSFQGAGGVGGLISMTVRDGLYAGTYFYSYDGHHNPVALVRATDGAVMAEYEYGPFHEVIRATGPLARINCFLAATKYYDWETGLYWYGFRYYSPRLGRWMGKDPIGERGGANIYNFVGNDSISRSDRLGLNYSLCTGIRTASSYNRPEVTIDPTTADANDLWGMSSVLFFTGANNALTQWNYDADSSWTKAFVEDNRKHFDKARNAIRKKVNDFCCAKTIGPSIILKPQRIDYNLNDLSANDNATILIEDALIYSGFLINRLKRLGSFRAVYTITKIDCKTRCATVKFQA